MTTLSKLIEMRHELFSAVEADHETGSHHRNNAEADQFAKDNPRLIAWMKKFAAMVDEESNTVEEMLR